MPDATSETIPADGRGHFFAVEAPVWARVCARGSMNEAVAYLVIARGGNFGTRTSAWSVDAIERRTGISRPRAKLAVESLVGTGLLQRVRAGSKPLYRFATEQDLATPPKPPAPLLILEQAIINKVAAAGEPVSIPYKGTHANGWPLGALSHTRDGLLNAGRLILNSEGKYALPPEPDSSEPPKPEWIWLPNSLIDGLNDEVSPIERVRQTQDVPTLRLLIDLYFAQSLAMNGGIHWRQTRHEWERSHVGQSGQYNVYGFREKNRVAWRSAPFVAAQMTGVFEKVEGDGDKPALHDTGWQALWDGVRRLEDLHLLEFVPHVIDADTDEGEVLHPYAIRTGERAEQEVGRAAHLAAHRLLSAQKSEEAHQMGLKLVPVLRHIGNVQLVSLLRLRHRARTAATAEWLSNSDDWAAWVDRYQKLGAAEPKAQAG